jgi:uncharacterized phage protein (TIGR01671 family)
MQREIKFRAFVKSLNKVLEVVEIRFLANEVGVGTRHDWHYHDMKDIELMQYTGMKDKNDIEIFDGDIVHFDYDFIGKIKVEFINGKYSICKYDLSDSVILGNIYENPELCN